MARIAFDIDDTIWKIVKDSDGHTYQAPDFDLIQVLRWFVNNGDEVFVWSAGGVGYAEMIVHKLGLTNDVKVIPKGDYRDESNPKNIDISFDDCEVNLAKVDIIVKREDYESRSN